VHAWLQNSFLRFEIYLETQYSFSCRSVIDLCVFFLINALMDRIAPIYYSTLKKENISPRKNGLYYSNKVEQ